MGKNTKRTCLGCGKEIREMDHLVAIQVPFSSRDMLISVPIHSESTHPKCKITASKKIARELNYKNFNPEQIGLSGCQIQSRLEKKMREFSANCNGRVLKKDLQAVANQFGKFFVLAELCGGHVALDPSRVGFSQTMDKALRNFIPEAFSNGFLQNKILLL